MGWDAFSEPFTPGTWGLSKDDPNAEGVKPGDRAWDSCVAELRATGVDAIDGLLYHGGLDCSICGRMLQKATGLSMYGDSWTPEVVHNFAEIADWSFTVDPDEEWAKASARAFLNHCAKLGKGIRFSF